MAILIPSNSYSTRNHSTGNPFALSNATQFITDTVDIVIDYDFESTTQQQVQIVSANSIQLLNGSWETLGFSVGNNLEFNGSILNGGNTVIYLNKPFTVTDVQGNLLTLNNTLEDPPPNPPQYTTSVVGQLMPAPNGSLSNTSLFIVNTSISVPESIEVFHNLVQNNSAGSDFSLFDGEVNRFRAVGTDTVIVGGFITMVQLGDKSGGTYKSVILERLADVGGKFSYQIIFILANPYKFESDDFDEPTQYIGSATLKPYYNFKAFPIANDPNSFLQRIYADRQGNLGWYDENYNQGVNDFTVQSVTFTTVGLTPLTAPDYSQTNIVTVVITGSNTFIEKVEGEFYLIPPINTVTNNANSNGDNISLSNFYIDSTGAPIIDIDVFGNNNAVMPTSAQSIALGVNEITVSFRLNPTTEFTTLVDSLNSNERQYRIALNVESHGGTANVNNAVSLNVSEGLMIKAPLVGGDFDGLHDQLYHGHNNVIGGAGALTYEGNPEDDILYYANINFNKADVWASTTLDVRITRDSDNEFFILEEFFIPFGSYVTTPNGVQQIQFSQAIQQFLESPDRNEVSMSVNGIDTATTYELDIKWSLMVNWRKWLPQSNAFTDFYDNTLLNNGLNREWMRYLRLAGYTLSTEVTLVDDANTSFRFGAEIELVDYDVTPDVTSSVLYYDENDIATTFFVTGQTNRIEATHVNNNIDWSPDNTWGWISLRPFGGEQNKRISTVWDWTSQNLPLLPLAGETKAKISYPSPNVAVVECFVDVNLITSGVSSVIVKIDDTKGNYNVHIEEINKSRLPDVALMEDRGAKFCKIPIRAVATLDNADFDKNSRLGLAYKFDSIVVSLVRQSDGVEILAPGLPVSFPNQSDAVGFVIDWRQLTRVGPFGTELAQDCYKVKVDWVLGGASGFFFECSIQLLQYNNMNTEGYVNIFVVLNDLVKKQGINYKGSGFASTLMFEGQFGFMQPNFVTVNNIYSGDSSRRKVDIKAIRTYELRTNQLLSCITQQLDEDYLLAANQIFITDWNANNHIQLDYTNFPVILSEDESPSFEYGMSVYASMKVVFKDKQQLHESKYNGDIMGSDNIIIELPNVIGAPAVSLSFISSKKLLKTNQTVSSRTGDDGDTQRGRDVTDTVLDGNNPFGNTARFTGITGGHHNGVDYVTVGGTITIRSVAFPEGVVLDWSVFDDNLGVVLTYIYDFPSQFLLSDWNTAVDNALAYTTTTFSGWAIGNKREVQNIDSYRRGLLGLMPFDVQGNFIWTGSEPQIASTVAFRFSLTINDMIAISKINLGFPMPVRYTTLTELGL